METPIVPAAQQLIGSSDSKNIRAAHWADHRWNAEWEDNPQDAAFSSPTPAPNPRSDPPNKGLGPA